MKFQRKKKTRLSCWLSVDAFEERKEWGFEEKEEKIFFLRPGVNRALIYIYTRIHCGLMRFIFRVTFFEEGRGRGKEEGLVGVDLGERERESWMLVQSNIAMW